MGIVRQAIDAASAAAEVDTDRYLSASRKPNRNKHQNNNVFVPFYSTG